MKGKVIVDADIANLCSQISKLNDTIYSCILQMKKLEVNWQLWKIRTLNLKSESSALKKLKPSRNSTAGVITLSYLLIRIIYQKIIWRKLWLTFATIPVWKLNQQTMRVVIVCQSLDIVGTLIKEFANRKYCEALLRNKKSISSKDFSQLNVHGKVFISASLCPYYRYISGKCKDLQKRGKIYQVIWLGGTIAVKVTERSSAMKIFHECDILDFDTDDVWKRLRLILFCKYGSILISVWNPSLLLRTLRCSRPSSYVSSFYFSVPWCVYQKQRLPPQHQ